MLIKVRIDRSQSQYCISIDVYMNTHWRQVSSGARMVYQQRHMPSGKKIRTRLSNNNGSKPSQVALHQNHAKLFIEILKQMPKFYSKSHNAKIQVGRYKKLETRLYCSTFLAFSYYKRYNYVIDSNSGQNLHLHKLHDIVYYV